MLDLIRHIEVFNPEMFDKPVHVIGAGATGSWLVMYLAKLGVEDITVWDFDVIESHNIPNQIYRIDQIGEKKVTALKELVKDFTGIEITAKDEFVDGDTVLEGVVFLLTDTMSSREEIFQNACKLKPHVDLVIETRMDFNGGRIYTINPMDFNEISMYEDTFYTDEEADVVGPSACGASQTIVATAVAIVSHAIWALINFANSQEQANEILLDMEYSNQIVRYFE